MFVQPLNLTESQRLESGSVFYAYHAAHRQTSAISPSSRHCELHCSSTMPVDLHTVEHIRFYGDEWACTEETYKRIVVMPEDVSTTNGAKYITIKPKMLIKLVRKLPDAADDPTPAYVMLEGYETIQAIRNQTAWLEADAQPKTNDLIPDGGRVNATKRKPARRRRCGDGVVEIEVPAACCMDAFNLPCKAPRHPTDCVAAPLYANVLSKVANYIRIMGFETPATRGREKCVRLHSQREYFYRMDIVDGLVTKKRNYTTIARRCDTTDGGVASPHASDEHGLHDYAEYVPDNVAGPDEEHTLHRTTRWVTSQRCAS